MLNLVEKFTPAVEAEDEGVVGIEYVLVAGVVAAVIGGAVWTGALGKLAGKLDSIITAIP
jgi:Flp pilus assembly pilin Flp